MEGCVLVSFIGRGQQPSDPVTGGASRSGYVRTRYRFPADGSGAPHIETASVFGAALLRWLRRQGQGVTTWLVLGTSGSMWADLVEAVEDMTNDAVEESWQEVAQAGEESRVDAQLLARWQSALQPLLAPTSLALRLVDPKGTGEDMWEALYQTIPRGSKVILDITHAFRHQPVLASFMIVALRWLLELQGVDLYYGALRMSGPPEGTTPVYRLSLCNRLFEAAEALATFRHTGDYVPLARQIELADEVRGQIERAAFIDEIHGHAHQSVRGLMRTIEALRLPALERSLADLLVDALRWSERTDLVHRMAWRARHALEHRQFSKAVMLLFEAIRVASARRFLESSEAADVMQSEVREKGTQRLRQWLEQKGQPWTDIWEDLREVRNAVSHAGRANRAGAQRALASPEAFAELFERGESLLKELYGEPN